MKIIPLATLILCGAANAQIRIIEQPTPLDLKAAYCVQVLKQTLQAVGDDDPKASASFQDALRRIQLYIVPRLPSLETTPIAAAMSSAAADMGSKPDDRSVNRIVECFTPSWLPF